MKGKLTVFLLVAFSINALYGQPPETIYQGNLILKGFYQDISPSNFGPYPIGFNFSFFGNSYSQFYVSANGLVLFDVPEDSYQDETTIPAPDQPNNFIAPFWDNLSISESGSVMYKTVGSAGSRKCILQFKNMGFDPVLYPLGTFIVILYESTNIVQVQYRLIQDPYSSLCHGGSATIGLENSTGTAGIQHKYHDANAVNSEDAISFTPSGATYITNTDATYDGVFLTENTTLPDPGISNLICPATDAITGTSQTFEWSAASNTAKYYIAVDVNSDLMTARFHNAGTNLTYDTTGLALGQTYYWAVFSLNATATTWGEVKRFTTSSTPPLTAVPRVLWLAQGEERNIKLQYTGGDASAKSAIVTLLPSQGQLWQVSGGTKSTQITSVPATVTDPGFNLVYVANGSTGNNAGSFNFKFHDDTGDSPEVSYKINVNPPGIPNLLYTSRSTAVELQFDRKMSDPAGKESQFAVTVNSTPATISSASLKANDPYSIILNLSAPLAGGETVLVSYAKGTVAATTGGLLESFTDETAVLLSQTLTFATNLTKKYGDPAFGLSTSSTSGLTAFTYSSSNFSVATISSATVTITGVGTSEITAFQAGNLTYAPARYIKTLNVSKGDQVITFGGLADKTFGDPDFTLSATSSSLLTVSYSSSNTDVATVTGNLVHITGAGPVTITASQAGNTIWNAATDVPQTFTVERADQTITFDALTLKTFGDADFALSATSGSGLTVTFTSGNTDVATITGNIVHIAGAGDAVITAEQSGNANWNSAVPVNQTLTIQKAAQTITFGPLDESSLPILISIRALHPAPALQSLIRVIILQWQRYWEV